MKPNTENTTPTPLPSIFNILREIRKYPSMFLGQTDEGRLQQIRTLDYFISGYTAAILEHKLNSRPNHFHKEFATFVQNKHGWSMSQGPLHAFVREIPNADLAWDKLWEDIWEFEQSIVESVPHSPKNRGYTDK